MLTTIFTVLFLCFLEGVLSLDNAMVLAILVRALPVEQRKKALTYGIGCAFIFRALAIFLITRILGAPWIKLIGGGYLVFLAVKYFFTPKGNEAPELQSAHSAFWKVVIQVEIADILFSADSILASVGVSNNYYVILTGGILGIIMMRFVAQYFMKLIDNFPGLETSAYVMIFFIGTKLFLEQAGLYTNIVSAFFWLALVVSFVLGFFGSFIEELLP